MIKKSAQLLISEVRKSDISGNYTVLESHEALAHLRAGGKPRFEKIEDYFAKMDRRTVSSGLVHCADHDLCNLS
jgi:hypothetical protein